MSDGLRSSAHPGDPPGRRRKLTGRACWPWLRRAATTVFFGLVGWLLVSQARGIEWEKVLSSLQNYSLATACGAVALAAVSFVLYSCFDLLGRHDTGHRLRASTVMGLTFVSYAFNLNLGSWVGGIALRYRLYSRLGLDNRVITRIVSLSMLTNWTGYLLLAGAVFAFQPPALPPGWKIGSQGLHGIGFLLLAAALAYLALCAFSRQRSFTVHGQALALPSLSLALLQVAMGTANWLLMSGMVYVLLKQQVEFSTLVGVLLLAAIAGVITHVPANLGVLEAVFVSLLSHEIPKTEILTALIAYRVLYYLIPLALAAPAALALELSARRLAAKPQGVELV